MVPKVAAQISARKQNHKLEYTDPRRDTNRTVNQQINIGNGFCINKMSHI
jgi:hypothetical protein